MDRVAAAGDGPGLRVVNDLEKVVFTKQRAAAALRLPQLLPDSADGYGPVIDGADSFPVQSPGFVGRHDAEVVKQQLAHGVVYRDDGAMLALVQQIPHQVLVEQLVVRLHLHGFPAQGHSLRQAAVLLQQGQHFQQGLNVHVVEIGGNGDHPGLRRELLQKITLIQFQGLQIRGEPRIPVGSGGAGAAKRLKIIHIKGKRHIGVPGITAFPADDERMTGGAVQLVQRGADPVEHGLQRVERIGAAFVIAPQQTHQLFLRDGTAAAINHVCQQQPHLFGAVVIVVDLLFSFADGKIAEHPYLKNTVLHHNLTPPLPERINSK